MKLWPSQRRKFEAIESRIGLEECQAFVRKLADEANGSYVCLIRTRLRKQLVTAELFRRAESTVLVYVDRFESGPFGMSDVLEAANTFLLKPGARLAIMAREIELHDSFASTLQLLNHPRTSLRKTPAKFELSFKDVEFMVVDSCSFWMKTSPGAADDGFFAFGDVDTSRLLADFFLNALES